MIFVTYDKTTLNVSYIFTPFPWGGGGKDMKMRVHKLVIILCVVLCTHKNSFHYWYKYKVSKKLGVKTFYVVKYRPCISLTNFCIVHTYVNLILINFFLFSFLAKDLKEVNHDLSRACFC